MRMYMHTHIQVAGQQAAEYTRAAQAAAPIAAGVCCVCVCVYIHHVRVCV